MKNLFFLFFFQGRATQRMLKKVSRILKSEARNPKSETNSNNRSTKLKTGRRKGWKIWSFGFRICFGFRYSNFEFRKSHQTSYRLLTRAKLVQNYPLNFSRSRASIFSNRLLCLPPAKGVSSQTFTISFASPFPTILPPIIKIFASLCSRLHRQE